MCVQATDISILASWYREHGNHNSPVVIIIDDMERCSRSVLSDFILMLRSCVAASTIEVDSVFIFNVFFYFILRIEEILNIIS